MDPNLDVSVGTFNVRRLRKRLQVVHPIAQKTMILGLCETWIRNEGDPLLMAVDKTTEAATQAKHTRGYGGVALIINPVLPYKMIEKRTSPTIQWITVRVVGLMLTVIYVSPRPRKEEEVDAFSKKNSKNDCKAIVMGDLNARCLQWDSKNNPRGIRLRNWAKKHGWTVKATGKPSCRTSKGTSTPDIFLTKGVDMGDPQTDLTSDNVGSDHFPVLSSLKVMERRHNGTTKTHIPRKQRTNPRIVTNARELYETELNKCLEAVQNVTSSEALETAYKAFKVTVLSPWESSTRVKPRRYKNFWNSTLDSLARQRRRLYRAALSEGTTIAREKYKEVDKTIKRLVKKNKECRRKKTME